MTMSVLKWVVFLGMCIVLSSFTFGSNATNPLYLSNYTNTSGLGVPNNVVPYTLAGNDYIYVIGATNISLINVTNKATPVLVTQYTNTSISYYKGKIVGTYLYVVSVNEDLLATYNISNISAITNTNYVTSTTRLDGAAWVTSDGNYLYISAGEDNMISVYNITGTTNSATPVFVSSYVNSTNMDYTRESYYYNGILYVAAQHSKSIILLNTSNLSALTPIGSLINTTTMNTLLGFAVSPDGNWIYGTAYVTTGYFWVVNATNKSSLKQVFSYNNTNYFYYGVDGRINTNNSNILYMFAQGSGSTTTTFSTWNISTPQTPTFLSYTANSSFGTLLYSEFYDNYLYIPSSDKKLLSIWNAMPDVSTVTDACIYSGTGTWWINNTICNITTNTNVLTNNLYIINSTVIINATVSNYTIREYSGNSVVTRQS